MIICLIIYYYPKITNNVVKMRYLVYYFFNIYEYILCAWGHNDAGGYYFVHQIKLNIVVIKFMWKAPLQI